MFFLTFEPDNLNMSKQVITFTVIRTYYVYDLIFTLKCWNLLNFRSSKSHVSLLMILYDLSQTYSLFQLDIETYLFDLALF